MTLEPMIRSKYKILPPETKWLREGEHMWKKVAQLLVNGLMNQTNKT